MADFKTVDEYLESETESSSCAVNLNGVVVSRSIEGSNEISVATVSENVILISLSGSDHHSMRIGDARQDGAARPGDVAMIPKGVALHSAWQVTGCLRSLALVFDESLFARFAPDLLSGRFCGGHMIPANYAARPAILGIAELLSREVDGPEARGKLFSDSLHRLLALELARDFWSVPTLATGPEERADRRISRAIDYIEAHFAEDISIEELAQAAGISMSSLTAQFRKSTGQSPYAYVIERRLKQASTLLRGSDLPIVEVALATGFADQAHLTRAMRSRHHMTPGQLRRGA